MSRTKFMRGFVCILMAFVFVIAFAACDNQDNAPAEETQKADTEAPATDAAQTSESTETEEPAEPQKLFEETETLTILCTSHPSYPYSEDMWVFNAVEDAANVELNMIAVLDNFDDKFNVQMASGDLPDIIYGRFSHCNQYYDQGAYVSLSENIDKMPNVKAYMDSDERYEQYFNVAYAMPDGQTYILPWTGNELILNKIGWMFRKDIFDLNGLEEFSTDEEMYETLKDLKEIYPESYPLSFRKGVGQLHFIAPSYGTADTAYYDFENDDWKYGPISDEFKTMVMFYNKLYEEDLIPPDFLSFSTGTWENTIITSSAFVTIDYYNRTNMFNGALTEENPDALLAYTPGPKGSTLPEGEERILLKSGFRDQGAMVCNTDNQDNAIKYLDWLFTDEATWLVSWGIEGETFEMVDDRPKPILDDGETVAVKYGIGSDGLAIRRNGNDFGVDGLKEYVDAVYASEDIEQVDYNPIIFLKYTPEQQEVVSTVGTEIETYVQETISKFLVGEKDFSEWDSYVAEVESMGLDEYLAVLTEAYDAVK